VTRHLAIAALAAAAAALLCIHFGPAATAHASPTATSGDGRPLALTPPMGWNDWAHYQCGVTEANVTANADALVSSGLAAKGYDTVTTDDCWMAHTRDSSGNLVADPVKFPHGMDYVGQQLHAMGLKFGIYEDAGTNTCQGAAGSYGHFDTDAADYAKWGVDYLKLDYCYQPLSDYPGKTPAQVAQIVYTQASQALLKTGRPMVFSESAPAYYYDGQDFWDIMKWIGQEGNLWRVGDDIADNWSSVLTNYTQTSTPGLARYAGPGHWNDADMLETGNPGLTLTEQQSQFTLWSELASPLLLSTDVGALSGAPLAIVSNKDVIAVDQDPLGRQGTVVQSSPAGSATPYDVLSKPLANGDRSVVLFNKADIAQTVSTTAATAGLPGGGDYTLKNLVTKARTRTTGTIAATVPPHGTVIYRVSRGGGTAAPATVVGLGQRDFPGGKAVTVPVSLTDDGPSPLKGAALSLSAPAGWTVTPSRARIGDVLPGHSATAEFTVTAPTPPEGRSTSTLTATAAYTAAGERLGSAGEETVSYDLPYTSLAHAFDDVGVSDESDTAPGNFDGDGDSYSAQALAAAGVTPGATLSANGYTFTWPSAAAGTPDNVAGGSPTIELSGSGSRLAFLGAEAGFTSDTVTVHYTDGSSSTGTLGFPNWCCGATDSYGAQTAFTTDHRNTPTGPANYGVSYRLYTNAIPLTAGKQVASVTLPSSSAIHVFAMAVQP
jgi:hypothetical protein